jgi:hypothetical protein
MVGEEFVAVDERRRQKKLVRKAAKRKKALAARKPTYSGGGGYSAERMMAMAAASPIHECLMPAGLFDLGMGSVIISRKMPDGEIGFGVFLIDVFCLGVKDAFFSVRPQGEYMDFIRQIGAKENLRPVEPACAVKLIEKAVAYARDLGLNSHRDYAFAKRIFGSVDPAACSREYLFGKDGKPLYMAGPTETEAASQRILDILTKKLGPDGFHYMTPIHFGDEETI